MRLPPLTLQPPVNGVVREAAVDELVAPQTSVQEAVNLHFDRVGAATVRLGLTIVDSQVEGGAAVLGMHGFVNNAGTIHQLLAMVDQNVYRYNGTNWSSVRGSLTAGSEADFTTFLDSVVHDLAISV